MKLPRKNKILSIIPYKKNTFKITTSLGVNFRVPEEILLKVPLSEGSELSESDTESETESESSSSLSGHKGKIKMLRGYLKNTKKYKKILFEDTLFPE